jgi:hypothetical protein
MRNHSDIVRAAGAERLALLRRVSIHTVRSWGARNRIPAEQWAALARAGHASLEELAHAAARCASCGEMLCGCSDAAWTAAIGGRAA